MLGPEFGISSILYDFNWGYSYIQLASGLLYMGHILNDFIFSLMRYHKEHFNNTETKKKKHSRTSIITKLKFSSEIVVCNNTFSSSHTY